MKVTKIGENHYRAVISGHMMDMGNGTMAQIVGFGSTFVEAIHDALMHIINRPIVYPV
jgi:hypothetical protein